MRDFSIGVPRGPSTACVFGRCGKSRQ